MLQADGKVQPATPPRSTSGPGSNREKQRLPLAIICLQFPRPEWSQGPLFPLDTCSEATGSGKLKPRAFALPLKPPPQFRLRGVAPQKAVRLLTPIGGAGPGGLVWSRTPGPREHTRLPPVAVADPASAAVAIHFVRV